MNVGMVFVGNKESKSSSSGITEWAVRIISSHCMHYETAKEQI